MKIKYRIKQVNDRFYCQKKILLWRNIKVSTCIYWSNSNKITINLQKSLLTGRSLNEAIVLLRNYKNNYLRPFICKHTIVKTYFDKAINKFIYVDTSSESRFSSNAEEICEIISEYEDKCKPKIYEYSEED